MFNGDSIEDVSNVGSVVLKNGGADEDIKARLGKAIIFCNPKTNLEEQKHLQNKNHNI